MGAPLFREELRFDPARDGKVPLRRTPLALSVRLVELTFSMLISRHPGDWFRWLRSMLQRRWPLSYPIPWLTFDAVRAIRRHVGPTSRVFEYGSGHSTLYWAMLGAEVIAVEDDAQWFERLQARVAGLSRVRVYLEQERGGYLDRIDREGGSFDMVLVDGSHREECLDRAIRHVRPGGLLVVDNTDWHWFREVDRHVPLHWKRSNFPGWAPFIGHRSETSVWVHVIV